MILLNALFILIFILGIYYLLWYRYNLKKAVDYSKNAIFPKQKDEFAKILIPAEWKEIQPLTTKSTSYQIVKWGTVLIIILFVFLLWYVLTHPWINTALLNIIYIFCSGISFIQHPGNFYMIQNGIVLNGRYYSMNQVKNVQVEQIVRWHELYGLNARVDNAYKLTFDVKKFSRKPHFVVVEDEKLLNHIIELFKKQNVPLQMHPQK